MRKFLIPKTRMVPFLNTVGVDLASFFEEINSIEDDFKEKEFSLIREYKGLSVEDFRSEEKEDACLLDPGGIARVNPERAEFSVGGLDFLADWEKIGAIPKCIENGEEVGDYYIFLQWMSCVVIPTKIKDELIETLNKLQMKSQALNASLEYEDFRQELEDKGITIRRDRENLQRG